MTVQLRPHWTLLLLGFLLAPPAIAAGPKKPLAPHKPDEILVRFTTEIELPEAASRMAGLNAEPHRRFKIRSRPESPNNRLFLMKLKNGWTVEKAIEILSRRPDVERVQPNHIYHPDMANDPSFAEQWGLDNTGQAGLRGPLAPTVDADIDWPEANALLDTIMPPATPAVIGVTDTGIDLDHPDLASVIWTHPGEIPGNGIDDDLNGYTDDVQGWDFFDGDNLPQDLVSDGHGTHVSGTVGAVVNNAIGVTGTASHVRIMPLRFLGPSGGSDADAIDAINYAIDNGASVINASWGGSGFSTPLYNAIADANAAGVLFVAAAGNEGLDNDTSGTHHYPSDYDLPNIVSVANFDRWDHLSGGSNWGVVSVDLAGPGDDILSTLPDDTYSFFSGTSMATPHVTGAAAILVSYGFATTPAQILTDLLFASDPRPDHHLRTGTSGRLNLGNLITHALGLDTTPPGPIDDLQVVNVGSDFVVLRATATGDDGVSGKALRYFVAFEEDALWTGIGSARAVIGGWVPGAPGADDYFTVTGLDPGIPYRFQLEILDDGRNSALSNELVVTTAGPDPAQLFEDFESGAAGWTTGSTTPTVWALVTDDAFSPIRSAVDSPAGNYPNNAFTQLLSPPIDLSTVSAPIELTFWQQIDFEDGWDFGHIDITDDGGSFYSRLLTQTGTDTNWNQISLDISPFAGSSLVQIRFLLESDFSITRDGWRIDDVQVVAPPPSTPLLVDPFDSLVNWTTLPGGDWALSAGGLSDSPGGDYGVDTVDTVTLASPLDLSMAGRASLQFDLEFDYEDTWDFLFLDVSTDGLYWREIARWTGTRAAAATEGIDLAEYSGYPEVWLRFRNSSDFTITAAGAEIDNFRVDVTAMPDGDGDGFPDFLDCAPGDGGAFAPPGEIAGLFFHPDGETMEWGSEAGNAGTGIYYDVVRGSLADLPVGSMGTETCQEMTSFDTETIDAEMLTPGMGYFYVIRGVNSCAIGSYGYQFDLTERLTAACP